MPHETTYRLGQIDGSLTVARPERLIDDKAYNNDPLDGQCTRRCIAMIAPTGPTERSLRLRTDRCLPLRTPVEGGVPFCMVSELLPYRHPL